MTKEEFISRKANAEQRIRSAHRIPMGIFYSIIFAMVFAIPWLIGQLGFLFFRYGAPPPATVLGELIFCAFLLVFIWLWSARAWKKLQMQFDLHGVKCLSCQKFLMFAQGDKTLASGRCWNCGERLFDQ